MKRAWVRWIMEAYQVSGRRAMRATGVASSTMHYHHRRPAQTALRARLREPAAARVSYGYLRLYLLLWRDG